ncbi:MAG: TonB-dependent receptor [Bacteroidota bacterium]
MIRLLLAFLLTSCWLSPVYLFAQSTSTLTGKVTDAANGTPLAGATVFVIGTYKGAYTKDDGSYVIKDLKPGDYSIRFTYVGYAEKVYNGISLSAGRTRKLDADMKEVGTTLGEVEIVGERTLIDLESGKSEVNVSGDDIIQMSVKNVQEVVAMQVGVSENPDGIQIRGGRVYETEYLVDGVSAQDPLAGTGFGVDVNAQAVQNVQVITGGSGAEYGGGTSGVIATTIREGQDQYHLSANYTRDNLGYNVNEGASWNTDEADISFSGPVPGMKDKLTFFLSGSAFMSDNFFRAQADQLHSSLFTNDSIWAPRQDNRWAHTVKLAYRIRPGLKLTLTNQHSLNINQSTRSLQIIGNDAVVQPGFQYGFSLDLDNANTYTHHSNLTALNVKGILGDFWSVSVTAGRLFTNLRADANGRPFRTETVDRLFDPQSIVTGQIDVFNPTEDSVTYVFPGPGLVNNGGIATLWHDHYAEEYTLKTKFTYKSPNKIHYIGIGFEHKEQEYQWIDVTRPWVGAPIQINDSLTTPSTSLGRSSDFWKVRPATGGIFFQDEIRYKGIIAVLGLRFNYWAPGAFADDAVANEVAPVVDAVRADYLEQTTAILGRRWKARLLPRLNVSFPVTENNVLYFNYSHSMRLPHPRFVYAGLDPVYQDRSFLSNLGNPNINPEVSVAYEVGLKSQLTKDMALTATAFYKDNFDYIVSRRIQIKDPTGRFVEKTFFINQDYARIRGIELALTRRIGKVFTGTISGAYQIATGKSNTAAESALQIRQQGFVNASAEQFLAWYRPFDCKLLLIFTPDSTTYLFNKIPLEGFRVTLSSTYKSGLRYTPYRQIGTFEETGRDRYELIEDRPFDEVGEFWFWTDLMISRDFFFGFKDNVRMSFTLEIKNLTNYRSAAIVNGVTGRGYRFGDPLPESFRDPAFPDPQDRGTPPFNPARFTTPRQVLFGVQFGF